MVLYRCVVDIAVPRDVHVVHRTVIEEVSTIPAAASISLAEVTESVVDSAIEADFRAPVAIIEEESAVSPTPVARCPEEAFFRRHYPRAVHPVVIGDAVIIGPVSRGPEIAVSGANRLLVDWQRGWADSDTHANLSEDDGRYGNCKKR